MNSNLIFAFGLVLVLEGLLPLLAPSVWRETFIRMIKFTDGQLRFVGLGSMVGGLVIILLSRS